MEVAHVEEVVKRLSDQRGVQGVIISNGKGVPIRSTMDAEKSIHIGALVAGLARQAQSFVREVSPEENLQFLRLRSNGKEIMIAPNFDMDNEMSLTVIQSPSQDS